MDKLTSENVPNETQLQILNEKLDKFVHCSTSNTEIDSYDWQTIKQLIAYYEQGQWVSVDNLPEIAEIDDRPIFNNGREVPALYKSDTLGILRSDGRAEYNSLNWFVDSGILQHDPRNPITHWCKLKPLPEPPKENTNG